MQVVLKSVVIYLLLQPQSIFVQNNSKVNVVMKPKRHNKPCLILKSTSLLKLKCSQPVQQSHMTILWCVSQYVVFFLKLVPKRSANYWNTLFSICIDYMSGVHDYSLWLKYKQNLLYTVLSTDKLTNWNIQILSTGKKNHEFKSLICDFVFKNTDLENWL